MAKLWCCRRYQRAEIMKITPTRDNTLEEFIFFLEKCNSCGRSALEILRMNLEGEFLPPVRLKTKNIDKFLSKINIIWKPKKVSFPVKNMPAFVLHYNEYGTRKACGSNLYSLDLGKIETDPYAGLKHFKKVSACV